MCVWRGVAGCRCSQLIILLCCSWPIATHDVICPPSQSHANKIHFRELAWPLSVCVLLFFLIWLLSRFNCTSLASRSLTIPSFLPFSFLAFFPVSSTGDSPVTCVLSPTRFLSHSLSSTFSGSLNNSWQGLVCTLWLCSGISELSSGHGAHYTEPGVEFLLRTSSTQHPAHSDIMLSGIIITITFCTLRAPQTGWGVP